MQLRCSSTFFVAFSLPHASMSYLSQIPTALHCCLHRGMVFLPDVRSERSNSLQTSRLVAGRSGCTVPNSGTSAGGRPQHHRLPALCCSHSCVEPIDPRRRRPIDKLSHQPCVIGYVQRSGSPPASHASPCQYVICRHGLEYCPKGTHRSDHGFPPTFAGARAVLGLVSNSCFCPEAEHEASRVTSP